MPDDPKRRDKTQPGKEPRSFNSGAEDGYQTDTFSRGDQEGPSPGELVAGDDSAGAEPEATPDAAPLKATDDPDSRDAKPPRPDEGGVR